LEAPGCLKWVGHQVSLARITDAIQVHVGLVRIGQRTIIDQVEYIISVAVYLRALDQRPSIIKIHTRRVDQANPVGEGGHIRTTAAARKSVFSARSAAITAAAAAAAGSIAEKGTFGRTTFTTTAPATVTTDAPRHTAAVITTHVGLATIG
jgi:hypothetical protein